MMMMHCRIVDCIWTFVYIFAVCLCKRWMNMRVMWYEVCDWSIQTHFDWFLFLWWDQLASPYPLFVRHSECFTRYKINFASLCLQTSVATKIENGPQTNTKILWFLKMDQRGIWRIFVNSKILWRSSKIANSSNIFKDTYEDFQSKMKNFVVATWTNFPSSKT